MPLDSTTTPATGAAMAAGHVSTEEWMRRAARWMSAAVAAGDPTAIRAAYDARPAPDGWDALANVR